MALASESTGSQTCTISTTHTLASPSSAKTRVLGLDLVNLAAGDVLRVDILVKIVTGGTLAVWQSLYFDGSVDGGTPFLSLPHPAVWGSQYKITQTAGTGRVIPWTVITLD